MPVAVCVPPIPLLPTRWTIQLQKSHFRDFPGSPVVKTLHLRLRHFKGMCSIPGQGINIPTCCMGVAKKKNKKLILAFFSQILLVPTTVFCVPWKDSKMGIQKLYWGTISGWTPEKQWRIKICQRNKLGCSASAKGHLPTPGGLHHWNGPFRCVLSWEVRSWLLYLS